MEETRHLSIRPHLVLGVHVPSPVHGVATVENLGPGAALEIDLQLTYSPGDLVRPWKWPTLAAGALHEFLLPEGMSNLDNAAASHLVLKVEGTYQDVRGEVFRLHDEFDFDAWWSVARQANRRLARSPIEKIADAVEEIKDAVAKIPQALR